MSSFSDYCLASQVDQILGLQEKYRYMGPFFEAFSVYMRPYYIMTVWAPLIGAFDVDILIDLLLLVSITLFGSTLLKWVIPEHRPFWWVHETTMYTPKTKPRIAVFPATCETTSGAFSTHSAVFTIFLLVLGLKLVDQFKNDCGYERKWLKNSMYLTVIGGSTLMWATRMYLGTHFLHQCILGSLLAAGIAYYYYKNDDFQESIAYTDRKDALLFAVACSTLVCMVYGALVVLGVDLQWTVRVAFKWCGVPEYLKADTTPVYQIVRDLALIFGIAAAAPISEIREKRLNLFLSTPITLLLVFGNLTLGFLTPTNFGRVVFLTYVMIQHTAFTYVATRVIPTYCAVKE